VIEVVGMRQLWTFGGGRWVALAGLGLTSACYAGVSEIEAAGATATDGDSDSAGDGADDGGVDTADPEGLCLGDIDVGLSTLRRLTRRQYDNAIRDLLGIEANAVERFDADERVGPFSSNSIIPVTERGVEQYMSAAEDLAQLAVDTRLAELLPCDPATDGEVTCARAFIDSFGRRALRRPLSEADIALYEAVYNLGADQGGFASGIQLVLEAMLQAPDFLYLLEFGGADPPGNLVALQGYELASRLSFFLWSSTPDDELLDAAETLHDPDVLAEQARRMLQDPKARATIGAFHAQWVGLGNVGELFKDPELFPTFDDTTREALAAETARFAEHVFFEGDGRLQTLLTAPYTLIDEPLFSIYGLPVPAGHDPATPVMLDPTQRGGILTQPGFLAVHAHHNQTSPVHRGVAIRRNFLCQELPPPPPDVDNTPPPIDPNTTTKERFEQHKADPSCAGCHILIDDVGLAFEHYDAIGAWRTLDGVGQVDASGEVVGADDADGVFYGAMELSEKLAASTAGRQCAAQQWFRFALGRSTGDDDACAMSQMYDAFESSDFDLRELVVAMVMSPSFRYLRVEGGA
jgi:hypothetical protein